MNKFEKFDEVIERLIAIAVIGFAFGVIGWGIIILTLWIERTVLV